ncbi:MAG TPA: hypothetical protein VME68_14790 [Acidobacteriaceae bacterium]|nr:hypothetical protein [Acidobacteriaceae bacterium]
MRKARHSLSGSLLVAAFLIFFAPPARADAGIPMMPVRYPEILLFLIPVIAIETVYLKRHLQARWRRTLIAVAGLNLITTGMGYPLAYGIYAGLNWSLHFPEGMSTVFQHLGWLPLWLCVRLFPGWTGLQQGGAFPVLATFVVLLLPSFLLSGFVKAWLIDWYDLLSFGGTARSAVWVANRLSYLFLIVVGCMILYQSLGQP